MTKHVSNDTAQVSIDEMKQFALSNIHYSNDEIDIRKVWKIVWGGKWIILLTVALFSTASVFYALSLPNIYKSEALLVPAAQETSGMGGLASQFGGLASLAGISIGAGVDKTALAIEIMRSRAFISKFIIKHDLLVPLMASKSWKPAQNELVYDDEIYDVSSQQWVRDTKAPMKPAPSEQEAIKKFRQGFSVSQDKKTSMIILSVKHVSPVVAKQWVEWLIDAINLEMKSKDLTDANKSIAYLEKAVKKTRLNELQQVLYQIIEEQTKVIMFAEVREQYAFRTIDPAVVPEIKSEPKRALICILGALFGMFAGLLINYIIHTRKKISLEED